MVNKRRTAPEMFQKAMSTGSSLSLLTLCLLLSFSGIAQTGATKQHVFDDARVFAENSGERKLQELEKNLATLAIDTGAQLVFRTESIATGTTAKEIARKAVAEKLDPSKPGAVMVYVRADDSIGVSVTEGSNEIPEYVFATVEKPPGSRPELTERTEYAVRSANDMISVFRKYYSQDSEAKDKRKNADRMLMIAVVAGVFVLVFGFAFFQWRSSDG